MLSAPEPIASDHALDEFNCGIATLDTWLKKRALQNQASGASRCFVLCENKKVIGYYALASSAVAPAATTGRFRRNMPDPIPVVVLGRLAIDLNQQGRGLGRALFQDAARRVINAADTIGIRGLLVHALSEEAKMFYLRLGLDESPIEPMTLMSTVANLRAALGDE
jgi:GNAT superfamily N-acetyltransferase